MSLLTTKLSSPWALVSLTLQRLLLFLVCLLFAFGTYLLVFRTMTGKKIRASSENKDVARLLGVATDRMTSLTFVIGYALSGVGGAVGIYMILVASLDLIYGYTGLASLGHGASFGIGAYAFGILQVKLGCAFLTALLGGTLFTCVFSVLIGWPILRIKGPYFAMGTLAMATMVTIVIHNWDSLTGGVSLSGIPLPPTVRFAGLMVDFSSKRPDYYLIFFVVFLSIFLIRRLNRSRVGRAFQSVRENSDLAEALGVNILRYKLIAYVIASTIAAVAEGLYAGYMGSIEPEIAGGHMSFQLLVMIVVGGARTITGVVVGPLLLWFLPEFLEAAQVYRPLFFGVVLLFVIIFLPAGIAGKVRSFHPRIAKWIP